MERTSSIVFSPNRVGSINVKNRLVKSATFENAATTDGQMTDWLIQFYSNLAKGGVGMIITGAAAPYLKNNPFHTAVRVDDEKYMPGVTRLTKAVHSADGACKLILQLNHPGRQVATAESGANMAGYLPPAAMDYVMSHPEILEGMDQSGDVAEPTGPSATFDAMLQQTPRALSIEEIEEIVNSFADGVKRAQDAGFDGIQLHAAHGWLLSTFLSPHTNKRGDQYGGSLENNLRIIREIYERARSKVGEGFPMMIKINSTDFFPDGADITYSVDTAKQLADMGFDAIEVSGGMWESMILGEEELGWKPYLLPEARVDIDTREKEAYFLEGARAIKAQINSQIILVGGIRSLSVAEEILARGDADFISMARPLIRQPDLPNIWLNGGPDKAECISCNGCFAMGNKKTACIYTE